MVVSNSLFLFVKVVAEQWLKGPVEGLPGFWGFKGRSLIP